MKVIVTVVVYILLFAVNCQGVLEDVQALTALRLLKRRRPKGRRGRWSRWNREAMPEVCKAIRSKTIKSDFSPCDAAAKKGPFQLKCDEHNNASMSYDDRRSGCQSTNECQWYAPPGSKKLIHTCHANPCHRINNNRCTIQDTGGRCVWRTKEINLKYFGKNHPGCYKSPCLHPVPNRPGMCNRQNMIIPFKYQNRADADKFKEKSPFQCTWCTKGYGCQNVGLRSTAQCWNIGKRKDICNKCNRRVGLECSNTCAKECCDSPYCGCIAPQSVISSGNTAITILTTTGGNGGGNQS